MMDEQGTGSHNTWSSTASVPLVTDLGADSISGCSTYSPMALMPLLGRRPIISLLDDELCEAV